MSVVALGTMGFSWLAVDRAEFAQAATKAQTFGCDKDVDGDAKPKGVPEYYTVPTSAISLRIRVEGAQGHHGDGDNAAGGKGGAVTVTLPATPGDVLEVRVGCTSGQGHHHGGNGGSGGNTAGVCGDERPTAGPGGTGGGSSAVLAGGDVVAEAGGGGGGGGEAICADGGPGGAGSHTGENGWKGDGMAPGAGGNAAVPNGNAADDERHGKAAGRKYAGGGGGGGGGCRSGDGGTGGKGDAWPYGGGGGGGGGSSCVGGAVLAEHYERDARSGDGAVTIDVIGLQVEHSYVADDDNVTFSVLVTNVGSTAISGFEMTHARDPAIPDGEDVPTATCTPFDRVILDPISQPENGRYNTMRCDIRYELDLDLLNLGSLTNTATLSGVFEDPHTPIEVDVSKESSQVAELNTAPALGQPRLEVDSVDHVNDNTTVDVGDVVNYDLRVENTGKVTIGVTEVDFVLNGETTEILARCPSLPPGDERPPDVHPKEVLVCDYAHEVTAADIDTETGELTATATVYGRSRNGTDLQVSSEPVTTQLTQRAGLEVQATGSLVNADGDDRSGDVGDRIRYDVTITNTGNVSVGQLVVSNGMSEPGGPAPAVDCGAAAPARFSPGDTLDCTSRYDLTQDDVDHGEVVNVVTASGTAPDGQTVDSSSGAVTTGLSTVSGIAVTKTAESFEGTDDGTIDVGDSITYRIHVTNTGAVTLTNVDVQDEYVSPAGEPSVPLYCEPDQSSALAAGEAMSCTVTYEVGQADVDGGSVTSRVSARGTAPGGNSVTSGPPLVVTTELDRAVAVRVTKKAPRVDDSNGNKIDDVGDVIHYEVTVTNTGTVTVTGVEVADAIRAPAAPAPTLDCSPEQGATLAPRDEMTCTGTYRITQNDVDAGRVVNAATVGGELPDGGAGSWGPATVVTPLTAKASLVVRNAVTSTEDRNGNSRTDVGDVLVYSVSVSNSGTVSLGQVTVTQTLAVPAGVSVRLRCKPAQPGSVAPGATMTCMGTYTVAAAAVAAGRVQASASATGRTTRGAAVSSAVSVVRTALSGESGAEAARSRGGAGSAGAGGGTTGGGGLAFTGSSIGLPLALGGGLLVIGMGLLVLTRRRRRMRRIR